jgi:hypothetical protein
MKKLCLLIAVVFGAALAGAPAPASAASPPPRGLAATKTLVQARIDKRLRTLGTLRTAISGAAKLSSEHGTTLANLVTADTNDLTALRAKVAAESTVDAVRADEKTMIVNYRVYLLVVPKVRLTIAADAENAAIAGLDTVRTAESGAIATAKSKGKDVSTEQSELTDLTNQLAAARGVLAGKVAALLAVAPGPDATAITADVRTARTAIKDARGDLGRATLDAKKIHDQLQ